MRARATAFSGADRWFGVVARLVDQGNFYYVTVRSSNTISLRKLANGSIVTLDSAALPVSVGAWYTLRLEAVGELLRVYVNGRLTLEARDNSHRSGTYGLATYKTAAQFDDFAVTEF